MKVGERDGRLRLHLYELVFDVEDDLLQHLFGVLRAIDKIVQVGPH
jgi:hypothetical protein